MNLYSHPTSAAQEALPQAQTVLDPFHVVRWASNMLDECRRRVQHDILGRRGRKNDPLYKSRRTLLTRISYLSDANKKQLFQLFADEHHLEVDCTWSMYQRVVSAYNEPDRKRGKKLMEEVINIITASDLPKALIEVKGLGETLKNTLRASLPTSTGQEPATVQQKLSTGDLSTYEVPPWALEI